MRLRKTPQRASDYSPPKEARPHPTGVLRNPSRYCGEAYSPVRRSTILLLSYYFMPTLLQFLYFIFHFINKRNKFIFTKIINFIIKLWLF
jgi:hypothetical protein